MTTKPQPAGSAASPPSPPTGHQRWSVQTRAGVLLMATAAVLLMLILWADHQQAQQVNALFRDRVAQSQQVLGKLLDLQAEGAAGHAEDYTRWDEMVDFTHRPDRHWAQINVDPTLGTFRLDGAWIVGTDLGVLYAANLAESPALRELPAPPAQLGPQLRREPFSHFFARRSGQVVEVWTAPVQHSDDTLRNGPPHGYYLIARVWNADRLHRLSQVGDGTAALVSPRPGPARPNGDWHNGIVEATAQLPGLDGRPVATLSFRTNNPVIANVHASMQRSHRAMVAGTLVVLLLSWIALGAGVGRPLLRITTALRNQDPDGLHETAKRHDELGHLAQLVEEFFAQRDGLIRARAAAEAAMRAKSLFLANISHELRTPMHGILSFARFGVRDAATADRQELQENFEHIEACGDSLLTLLNDLLDLSKFEAGRMSFQFDEVSLADVADEAADQFASFVQERQLSLDVEADPEAPPVLADRLKVLQVFRNLLSNAARFTPPDGRVTIRVEPAGSMVRVTVRDTGRGIPEAELGLIFESFTQATNHDANAGGTGLGLAICREIVHGHEGHIWAENVRGGGAALVFELPVQGPAAAQVEVHPAA